MKLRFLFITLSIACGFILVKSFWPRSLKNSINKNIVTLAISSEPHSLDPRYGTDATSMRISNLLFQSLVRLDSDQKLIASAAHTWQYSNKIYTFLISKNIKFSNGRALSAEDILFSFKEYRSKKSPFAGSFQIISFVKVNSISDPVNFIVEVHLKDKSAKFLTADLPVLKLLPKQEIKTAGMHFYKNPIGTGIFKLSSYSSNNIILNARTDIPKPALIKKVQFKIIRDSFTLFQKMLNGEIDIADSVLPLDKIHWFKNKKKFQVFQTSGSSVAYLLLNLKNSCLQKKQMRHVLAISVHRKNIIQHKLHGMARLAYALLPPSHPFFNSSLPKLEFNPKHAKETLQKMPNCQNQIWSIHSSRSKVTSNIMRVISYNWSQIGLKAEIKSYEWSRFYKDLENGEFQIAFLQWTGILDPDIYRIAFHSNEFPPKGRNRGFYKNFKLDSLLDRGITEMNQQKRRIIYRQVQKIIAQDVAIIPLWHNHQIAVVKQNIKNYYPSRGGDFNYLATIEKTDKKAKDNK